MAISVKYMENGEFFYDSRYYASVNEANTLLAGGLVVCKRIPDDNGGRLRLHKLYASWDSRQNGWLDLFTYTRSNDELKGGFYLCKIIELRCDKKGYVNMIVDTIIYLGESITEAPNTLAEKAARALCLQNKEEDKPAWQFLKLKMSRIAFAPGGFFPGKFNYENAIASGFTADDVITKLLAGDVTSLDKLSQALLEPTEYEHAEAYIQKNKQNNAFLVKYPLLQKKLQTLKDSEIIPFLERKIEEFGKKELSVVFPENSSSTEVLLFKVEAILKYWKDINIEKKTAQRIAAKAAKRANA